MKELTLADFASNENDKKILQDKSKYDEPKTGTVNTDGAVVRKEASSKSNIAIILKKGNVVVISGEEGKYYRITAKAVSGYIAKKYVTL